MSKPATGRPQGRWWKTVSEGRAFDGWRWFCVNVLNRLITQYAPLDQSGSTMCVPSSAPPAPVSSASNRPGRVSAVLGDFLRHCSADDIIERHVRQQEVAMARCAEVSSLLGVEIHKQALEALRVTGYKSWAACCNLQVTRATSYTIRATSYMCTYKQAGPRLRSEGPAPLRRRANLGAGPATPRAGNRQRALF